MSVSDFFQNAVEWAGENPQGAAAAAGVIGFLFLHLTSPKNETLTGKAAGFGGNALKAGLFGLVTQMAVAAFDGNDDTNPLDLINDGIDMIMDITNE